MYLFFRERVINVWNSCLEQLTVEVVDLSTVLSLTALRILSVLLVFGISLINF